MTDSRQRGFTLVEVMVTTSLLFLVLTGVYTAARLAFRVFEQENKAVMARFDAAGYLMGLDRLFCSASQVRLLRSETGFYVLKLDMNKRQGTEVIHLVREGQLYVYRYRFHWENEPLFRDGEVFFDKPQYEERDKKKFLLKGVEGVTMNIHFKSGLSRLGGAFAMIAIVFRMAGKKDKPATVVEKFFPVGGHSQLTSRAGYLFQEAVED